MVNELRAVVKELGGRRVLGRNLASSRDLCEAIREGFPAAVVEELMQASGLTLKELADSLDLSPRSLQRRRRSGRLARFESDRLYRLARVVALAQQSLGDRASAARWQGLLGTSGAVVELSAGLAAFFLAGASAREALKRGCRLDLDPSVFAPGCAAATHMAQVAVTLAALPDGLLLLTPASTARHLREWLLHVGRPFGLAAVSDVTVGVLAGDP